MKIPSDKRLQLLAEVDAAPVETLFTQIYVVAIRDCSVETVERDRWAGTGIPFLKIGRGVRYRKRDILDWLKAHAAHRSTSEAALRV